MAAQHQFNKINLVPQDEFEKSGVGKILKWCLTAGKSIVIMTEFVVILAFLSRFKLDRDLNDLNEVINQKVQVVQSYEDTEKTIRALQKRINIVNKVDDTTIKFGEWWQNLSAITPTDTNFEAIDITREQISLKGLAGSDTGFSQLIAGIKKMNGVKEISINQIAFDQSKGGVSFELTAKLQEVKK